jgi:hypothetical protein
VEPASVAVPEATMDLGMDTGCSVYSGTTAGLEDTFSPSCSSSSAGDIALSWTAPEDGCYTFHTSGADWDTLMSIIVDNGACGDSETCDDDGAESLRSAPQATVSAGTAVSIVVTGYSDSSGEFDLHITECDSFSGDYDTYTCMEEEVPVDTGDPVIVEPV